jgi:hypothetical protein
MIDLEDALAPLVESAPEPPALAGVTRRGRQRRRRRHGVAYATAAIVLAVALGTAAVIVSKPSTPKVAGVPPLDHVHVTLLDGSQMTISGPRSLGLTKLEPSFNGELDPANLDSQNPFLTGHSFTVERTPSARWTTIGRYPTGDGHELVVHTTTLGVDGVVQYGGWSLVVHWGHAATSWSQFAAALKVHETKAGFLVVEPSDSDWKLGPTDAPDVQLGPYAFFGPSIYPAGCPQRSDTSTRTAQGWPVSRTNGAWWCDADAKVRVHVTDPALETAAIDGLRVTYQPL